MSVAAVESFHESIGSEEARQTKPPADVVALLRPALRGKAAAWWASASEGERELWLLAQIRNQDLGHWESRLMRIRLALDAKDANMLQMFINDPHPAVRWLAFASTDEMDGLRAPRPHHAAIAEAIRWARAFRAGRAKIPHGFETSNLGTVTHPGN